MNQAFYADLVRTADGANLGWLARGPEHGMSTGFVRGLPTLLTTMNRYSSWNFYLCPNPTTARSKPTTSEILATRWLVLDFDFNCGSGELVEAWAGLCTSLNEVRRPTWLVRTGRGLHAWYELDNWPTESRPARAAMRWFQAQLPSGSWHLDPTCADISHVFRMPGTKNTRSGSMAEIVQERADTKLESGFLEAALASMPEEPPPPKVVLPESYEAFRLLSLLPPTARRFLQEGIKSSERSRHQAAFATGAALGELEVAPDAAAAMAEEGARLCVPRLKDWERSFWNGFKAGRKARQRQTEAER